MTDEYTPYKCGICDNIGVPQNCNEHKQRHGHGMVHLKKEYKNGGYAMLVRSMNNDL